MPLALVAFPLHEASQYLAKLDPGVMWSVALLVALAYAVRSARRSGLQARSMYWAVVCTLLAGLWGAHLLSLLVHGWEGGPLALPIRARRQESLRRAPVRRPCGRALLPLSEVARASLC